MIFEHPIQVILGLVLILSSLGVLFARKPVHAAMSFLLTLITLATIYLQLSAQFIAVMQVLVYAGAILVIFMFVMVLFQDAHEQLHRLEAKSAKWFLVLAGAAFAFALGFTGYRIIALPPVQTNLPASFGSVEQLGQALYLDFFFPFEAVVVLFLVAVVGTVYIAKRVS